MCNALRVPPRRSSRLTCYSPNASCARVVRFSFHRFGVEKGTLMQTHAWTRIGEVLGHVNHHIETRSSSRQAAGPTARFTISIGRDMGVPDHEVAHELGQRLGWPV